jgi:nicotinamide phosphoribosyltransferase
MYPQGTTLVYSNFTPRSVKLMDDNAKDIVVFGQQYVMQYLHELFQNNFFNESKNTVIAHAKHYLSSYLNADYDTTHFEKLWVLGYLPIKVKALEEGVVIHEKIQDGLLLDFNRKKIAIPEENIAFKPFEGYLKWHRENRFGLFTRLGS